MSYIVEIVHYVAWPIVVLVIFFLIRNPLRLLLSSIEELVIHYKDFQASAKVKSKDVKNLTAPKVDIKSIAPVEPPDYKEVAEQVILLKDARKVLATLFDGQLSHFGEEDISKGQWSFRVLPHSSEYGNFMVGFAQLLALGLAGWEGKNGQAVLTKKGLEYAKEHTEIRESKDVYRF